MCFFVRERMRKMDKSMAKYIIKRIIISAITLFAILTILFMMIRSLPGTPFNSEKMTAAQIAAANVKYGLDKPLIIQYLNYLKNMGNYGKEKNRISVTRHKAYCCRCMDCNMPYCASCFTFVGNGNS